MITFSSLQEILKPEQKKEVDTWEKGDNSFSDHLFDHPSHTEKTIPLDHPDEEGYRDEIGKHLAPHGVKIKDYKSGIGEDKHGREVKLGKALEKTKAPDELKNKFANDSSRSNKNKSSDDLRVTISRHPHHVAGMTSSGQCWENDSCMNFETGGYREYLPNDVKHGTHVAYLHHKDDKDLEHPLARIALKKYTDESKGHSILNPENKTYGTPSDAFHHTVHKFINDKMPAHDTGIYEKDKHVYDDTGTKQILGSKILHHKIDKDDFDIDNDAQHEVYESRLKPEHIEKVMNKGMHQFGLHPDSTKEQFDKAVDSSISTGKGMVALSANRRLNSGHIHSILDSHRVTSYGKELILTHNPKVKGEHVMKYINQYNNLGHVAHMFNHGKLSPDHLHSLIDRTHEEHQGDSDMLKNITNNPNINHDHIDKILSGHPNDKNILRQLMYRNLLPRHVDHIQKLLHPKDFHDVAIHTNDTTGNLKSNHIHSIIDTLSKDTHNPRTEDHIKNLIRHKNFNDEHADKIERNQFPEHLINRAKGSIDRKNFRL